MSEVTPRVIEAVTIGYQPSWRKWPDSGDIDFSDVMAKRQDVYYTINGKPVTVRLRWYPVHHAYAVARVPMTPVAHPVINNTVLPPKPVLEAMLRALEGIAADGVELCYWEHAYQCYPSVAQHLKRLFKHSVLIHGDDCPGSTEYKTQPIARFFDSIFHANLVWAPTGETTANLYKRMGVDDAHYLALSGTGGLLEGISEWMGAQQAEQTNRALDADYRFRPAALSTATPLDLERRIQQLRERRYRYDMVFVGLNAPPYRCMLNTPEFEAMCKQAGLRTAIKGTNMRDGLLRPWVPATLGTPVAKLYFDSFSVLNRQLVSLMATRPFDAWATGTLLLMWDPFGELDLIGVKKDVHYASYDGSLQDLINRVKYFQAHFDEAEAIIRAGHVRGRELPTEHCAFSATTRMLTKFAAKFSL